MWLAWLVLGREQDPCQLSFLLNEFGNSCIRWLDLLRVEFCIAF